MKRDRNVQERGSALVIVLLLIIVALVAGGGWWAWKQHQQTAKQASSSSKAAASQSSKSASQQKTAATQPQPCDATTLSLKEGTSDGTAGTIYKHAVVTNTGSVACTISGYPTATLVDNNGAILGSAAGQNPLYPAVVITLSPGDQAHAVLGFPDAGAYDNPSACSAASTRLHLVLHGTTTTLSTAWVDQSCPDFSVTLFQLGA